MRSFGIALVLLSLALGTGGVYADPAGSSARVSRDDAGKICRVPEVPVEIPAELLQLPMRRPGGDFVPLNTRGYNYGAYLPSRPRVAPPASAEIPEPDALRSR